MLIPLFYLEEDWRGERAWNQFKQQCETKGERFDWAALPHYSGPDDENFARTPIVASSYQSSVDKTGRLIRPPIKPPTNVVNRLRMSLYREDDFRSPTNLSNWRYSRFTDLSYWQDYFRTPPPIKYKPLRYRFYGRYGARPIEPIPPTNGFPMAPHPQTPVADVLLALNLYDPAIEELRRATLLPHSSFPLHYDPQNPFDFIRIGGSRFLGCAEVLQLRAVAELNLGHTADALKDTVMGLHLAETATNESFNWGLWDSRVIDMTIQPIWEGLANHQWSDSQIGTLDGELVKFDFLAQYARQVRENRAMSLDQVEYSRKTHNANIDPDCNEDADLETRLTEAFYHAFPAGWYYENELSLGLAYQQLLSQFDLKKRITSNDRSRRPVLDKVSLTQPYSLLAAMTFRPISAIKSAYTQTSLDMARIACAAERYRLVFGEYPKSLDLLEPRFICPLPHDIIDGKSLHYRSENGQILIYSIGWDGIDDHGTVLKTSWGAVDMTRGDWSWRSNLGENR
ncbi:MAG TPA: hypothetical protein VH595_02015 [Verrucomicrobiae bacterium]|nr:hypothetical protein [Verrucomicrobiae bacterium]